jgi:hypothetical protein
MARERRQPTREALAQRTQLPDPVAQIELAEDERAFLHAGGLDGKCQIGLAASDLEADAGELRKAPDARDVRVDAERDDDALDAFTQAGGFAARAELGRAELDPVVRCAAVAIEDEAVVADDAPGGVEQE